MTDDTAASAVPPPPHDITPVTIEEEMRRSYLDYAMSVIVSRALPDARDGLKPVHRRILYGMKVGGFDSTKSYKKSARVVGDVMGKFHPHGDSAIYDAMVRMAQEWSMRVPLVDGQGNFGSMDGDPPAAFRYTEARMAKVAEMLLEDIEKNTVLFQPNYDDSDQEPTVLPARFPNLLVNGSNGIAVGMATNMAPHNLGEVIDACCALIENPDLSVAELMEFVPGPDFPTGGEIVGMSGSRAAAHTGRGSIVLRGRTHVEEIKRGNGRKAIIVTEVPFQVNKAKMIEKIAELVQEKTIEGISDLRDESDRDGVRVVIELKRDAEPDVVRNQLYRFTQLQTNFAVNQLALNNGRPDTMNLRDLLRAFLVFREEVIVRRTQYDLNKARERAHVWAGLAVAVANIDEIIATIRRAPDPGAARAALTGRGWPAAEVAPLIALIDEPDRPVQADGTYWMSEEQAKAILDLRLHRLTGLERDKIAADLQELTDKIAELLRILQDRPYLLSLMKAELIEIKDRFNTPRRTTIEPVEDETDIEDLIQREDMVVTVSHGGYVKRVPLSTYRAQRRGGRGRSGMQTKEEDFVTKLFVASTHDPMLFFTSRGMVYKLKVWRLPIGTPQSRGKALVNLLPIQPGEAITAVLKLPEDEASWGRLDVLFATESGGIRRNKLSDFQNIRSSGLIAMKLDEGDRLVAVQTAEENQDVLIATAQGRCIRFRIADEVRVFAGRTSTGVRAIRLGEGDRIISMSVLNAVDLKMEERDAWRAVSRRLRAQQGEAVGDEADAAEEVDAEEEVATGTAELSAERIAELQAQEQMLLTVTSNGFGKRTSAYEYRVSGRGGLGITALNIGEWDKLRRQGKAAPEVVAVFPVSADHQVMLVTDGGQVIRTPVHDIRIAGRVTQGVRLFRVSEGERVVSVGEMAEAEPEDDAVEVVDLPPVQP